jgi:hypothetical protein
VSGLDVRTLDRDIARAARAERGFWRTLRADANRAADDAWYEPVRHVTTRAAFQEVSDLASTDPMREALLAWIHRLSLTRIARGPLIAVAKARQDATLHLEKPDAGQHSVRTIVRHVLAEPERAKARAWLEGLAASRSPLLGHEKALREAMQEITARLGVADPGAVASFDRAVVAEQAERLLRRTDDLAGTLFAGADDLAGLVAQLVARDVPGVWPTRPDARWLSDQFQGSPLLQGLSLDLGPTPDALGAASFARALARLGAAYARSAVLSAAPFVATSDPSDLHPMRRGALFASLAADPVFLRKQLGLSRDAAEAATRALAVTFLAALRLAAVSATIDVSRASATTIAEAVADALKVPVAPELSGVFPRLSQRAPERVAAALLARADALELKGAFDDDWFRNPRGLFRLRELDAAPRAPRLPSETLRDTAEPLAKALEEMAG